MQDKIDKVDWAMRVCVCVCVCVYDIQLPTQVGSAYLRCIVHRPDHVESSYYIDITQRVTE